MAGFNSSLRPAASSSSSSSHSSPQSSSHVFNSKILLLLTLLPLSLAVFAFVLQWRGEIDDPTTRWTPKDRLEFPGTITLGVVTPNNPEEKVILIKKGDVVPLLAGTVSWWFNGSNTNAIIVFFAETSKALAPRQLTYFLVSGVLGTLTRSQSDFVPGLNQNESKSIVNSQQDALLVKLDHGIKFPKPSNNIIKDKLYATIDGGPTSEVIVKGSGVVIRSITESNFPMLSKIGLSARFVKLEGHAVLAPSYAADGSIQICFVAKGSGRVTVVGAQGKLSLDSKVKEGDLFVVPQFFATAEIADDCGMEVFSVTTSSKPIFGQLVGNTSIWNTLSPVVQHATLTINPKSEQVFKSKN
ncbi:hypothetical protein SSX86_005068 [Deinandra increscens subsp. villosa]|uniref:Cupin type-1 domain-containing protein n=1 Tax=Deinandra increscens subsp. villosa TaxID=3103831 RepID=A0AAP0DT50_9ASTR